MSSIPTLGKEILEVVDNCINSFSKDNFNEKIYELFGRGKLNLDLVSSLIKQLKNPENFKFVDFSILFKLLKRFYKLWSEGYFIDQPPENNYPQKISQELRLSNKKPLGVRQVDALTGLNVMILLLELHRFGREPDSYETQFMFHPCGKCNLEGFPEDPHLLSRIISYSNCIEKDAFVKIVGEFLDGSNLRGAKLDGVNLTNANLSEANLSEASLSGAFLDDADLRCAKIENSNLTRANLVRLKGASATFTNSKLDYANFNDAELDTANFQNSSLGRASLANTNLEDADLSRTYLTGAYLIDANLECADLRFAYLDTANLSCSNLTLADLDDANLSNVNFTNATLTEASLKNAFLNNADLNRAKDLKAKQIQQARNWESATYSQEFRQQLDSSIKKSTEKFNPVKSKRKSKSKGFNNLIK